VLVLVLMAAELALIPAEKVLTLALYVLTLLELTLMF